jgi:hypothetical protein
MKASELRIGNYVLDERDSVDRVKAISDKEVALGALSQSNIIPFSEVNPIPITEEWLGKVNYQYANENGQKFYWHTDLPYFQLRKDEDSWGMWYCESNGVEALISKKDIEYVHDIQNIHFYLSGEEL